MMRCLGTSWSPPLTSGVEGTALSLAKWMVMVWRWSLCVWGKEAFPPVPPVFNIRQFMTEDEVAEKVGEPHWFIAYSHAVQWAGEAASG